VASLRQKTVEPIPTEVSIEVNLCSICKHAISHSSTIYCAKIKRQVENVRNCPDFEPEPPEYRLYKRE
jgi:hypothetical protein